MNIKALKVFSCRLALLCFTLFHQLVDIHPNKLRVLCTKLHLDYCTSNLSAIAQKSSSNRAGIEQESSSNRAEIEQESSRNQAAIEQEPSRNRAAIIRADCFGFYLERVYHDRLRLRQLGFGSCLHILLEEHHHLIAFCRLDDTFTLATDVYLLARGRERV